MTKGAVRCAIGCATGWNVAARTVPAIALSAIAVAAAMVGGCTSAESRGNRAPVLQSPHVTTDEDTPVTIQVLAGANDPEADALSVANANAPGHSAKVIAGTSVEVTPAHDFNGMLIVTYDVTDGTNVVHGMATVMVKPVNDPPTTTG